MKWEKLTTANSICYCFWRCHSRCQTSYHTTLSFGFPIAMICIIFGREIHVFVKRKYVQRSRFYVNDVMVMLWIDWIDFLHLLSHTFSCRPNIESILIESARVRERKTSHTLSMILYFDGRIWNNLTQLHLFASLWSVTPFSQNLKYVFSIRLCQLIYCRGSIWFCKKYIETACVNWKKKKYNNNSHHQNIQIYDY